MAKRVKRPTQPNRRTVSRLQREAVARRWLHIGVAAFFGLIIILLGWGVYAEYVAKPRRVVAVVQGDAIRLDEYQRAVRFRQYTTDLYIYNLQGQREGYAALDGQEFLVQYLDQQIQLAQAELQALPETMVEELIEDRIIRQEAARRGITVTEEEVQIELETQFGYDRNPPEPVSIEATEELTATENITETATPTPVPKTYEEFAEQSAGYFQAIRQATGFTEQDFRELLESSLYRAKVEEALMAEMPTTAEQVQALHILVETEEEAGQVLARLEAGETFEDLATELSLDTSSGAAGGDLGWFPRGWMVEPFEEAAFGLAAGETSGPVQSQFGWHIIRVLERDPERPLEEADLQQYQRILLDDWYLAQKEAGGVEVYWDASMAPA
jgi:parvulin-like peptidyl-prolyl isomerase